MNIMKMTMGMPVKVISMMLMMLTMMMWRMAARSSCGVVMGDPWY